MAIFTPVIDIYGWEIAEVVVVQEPTFAINPATDFATFDWFLELDATKLTNAVIERALASGWDLVESNVTTPVADSDEASLAETYANLQTLFTDLLFGDAIDADFNNTSSTVGNATGYLTWSTWAIEQGKTDEEWFEAFCIKAGLTDGGGNYGFRYIADVGGFPVVTYPNSTRTVQAGDVLYDPDNTDIYLEDLLTALERIQYVGWELPDDDNRHGRKFSWESINRNNGSGSDSDMYWSGEQSVEFAGAIDDFSESSGIGTIPEASATSTGELEIGNFLSEYTSSIDSSLTEAECAFTTPKGGPWILNIKTEKPIAADTYDGLGSGFPVDWSGSKTGTSGEDEAVTELVGVATMDTNLFNETGVPGFSIQTTVDPVSDSGTELYDWFVEAEVVVNGGSPQGDIINNNFSGGFVWTGDLSEGDDPDIGEALNLFSGSYNGDVEYTLFEGSTNEKSSIAVADVLVFDSTTGTPTPPKTTTTAPATTTATTTGTTTTSGTTTTTTTTTTSGTTTTTSGTTTTTAPETTTTAPETTTTAPETSSPPDETSSP